jgi:hypothetical protein
MGLRFAFGMNSILRLLMGTFAGLLIWACAGHGAAASATNTVEIRQGLVFIDGNRINRTTKLSEYQAILGKPDRTTALKNTIHTYDNLGIRLYQRPGEDTVLSISLDFAQSRYEFSPKIPFKGAFKLSGQIVGADFPKSRLPAIPAVQIDPAFKALELPVIMASQNAVILTFEYLSSSNQLNGIGIAWRDKVELNGARGNN